MAAQSQSLSSLLGRATIEDHAQVLSTCNAELKKNKGDLDVQHAKVVALIKLDRYDEALHYFDIAGERLRNRARVELAYALYKVGKLDEATQTAGELETRAGKHVKAQALYRAEDFLKVAEIYNELEPQRGLGEEHDLRINRGAVDAQLIWQGNGNRVLKKKPDRGDLEAYETAFNVACASIARGELGQADVLLRRAKELCKHSEDLPEDEKALELLNIDVQQLYILIKLGKTDAAKELASTISVEDVTDLSTKRIAQSSLLSLQTDYTNPFLLHKAFNSTPETVGNDKLFNFQSDLHQSNSYAIDILASKSDGVARSTSKKIKSYAGPKTSASVVSLSVLNAASQAQGAQGKAAIKSIRPLLEQRPNDVGLVITLVQLYMSTNNPSSANDCLESFFRRLDDSVSEQDQDIRYNPGLIAVLIALYKAQGRKSQVTEQLGKAASYWSQKSPDPPKSMLLAAGKALLNSGESSKTLDTAREIFATLHKQSPDDRQVIAGYVASHALTSPESIQSSIKSLRPLAEFISDIDVASLEEAGIPQSTSSAAAARKASIANALSVGPGSKKRGADDSKETRTTKRRRLPKSRIPKDFVEGKQLDPDRWLPLRERASYRPKKGKKGRNRDGGATQGGPVKEESAVEEAKDKQQPGVISGGGGGGGKKKKGKKR